MSTIRATVTDQKLVITDAPELASGGKGTNFVAFEFCELWDGFTKTAVFYNRIDYKKNMAVGTNGICRIPSEIIAKKGRFFFGVFGIDEERNIKTSEVVPYGIKEGGYNEPSEPTDEFWMQVLAEIAKNETDIKEAVEEVKQVKGFAEGAMSLAESHALRHSVNGEDPLYPGDIGAAKQEHTHDAYDIEGMMESYFNEDEETLELGDLFEYEDEKYYIPSVDSNGILSWTASMEGMPDVPRTNVKGDPGITPEFQIGNVATLEPGEEAAATIGGTAEKPILNLALPKGEKGVGIEKIDVDQSLEEGKTTLVEIWLENGNMYGFTVLNGSEGKDGKDGVGIEEIKITQNNLPGGATQVEFHLTDGAMNGFVLYNGEDGFSPVVDVTEIEGGHRVSVTDVEGEKHFDVMDGLDAGEKLTGSTSDVTPNDVMTAIADKKTILLTYNDNTYGIIIFTNFSVCATAMIVAASVAFEYGGVLFNASLTGDITAGTWSFAATKLATKDDIPEEKIATDVDLSKYESEGIIVETYADGSSLTHNFEFDADGRPTKRTDSDGNVQTITW